MDTVFLSRIQFALTIGFHDFYPPLSIGLGLVLAIANIPREMHHGREWRAFVSSAVSIALVLGYTFHIYRVFQGKVKLDSMSY